MICSAPRRPRGAAPSASEARGVPRTRTTSMDHRKETNMKNGQNGSSRAIEPTNPDVLANVLAAGMRATFGERALTPARPAPTVLPSRPDLVERALAESAGWVETPRRGLSV